MDAETTPKKKGRPKKELSVGKYHKREYKKNVGLKDGRTSKAQAKQLAKGAFDCIAKINQTIINKAKRMKIYPDDPDAETLPAPGELLNAAAVVGANGVTGPPARQRSNKVLQAVYTLLEANIEAIMAKGLMTALTDQSAVGSQMVRYFLDMYLPEETIKRKWEAEDGKGNLTQIQQMMYIKMTMDTTGLSVGDLHKLVSEKTMDLKNITNKIDAQMSEAEPTLTPIKDNPSNES